MGLVQLLLLSIALAMDAFTAAVCQGLRLRRRIWRQAILIAFSFGFFQALMPLIGYSIGDIFNEIAQDYDHWIAFLLLSLLGAKMIKDSFENDAQQEDTCSKSSRGLSRSQWRDVFRVFLLAIATSIDALVVGFTFAFVEVQLWRALLMIGLVTFLLSLFGVLLGKRCGLRLKGKAELLAGVILMFLGFKILLEHTQVLAMIFA